MFEPNQKWERIEMRSRTRVDIVEHNIDIINETILINRMQLQHCALQHPVNPSIYRI